MSSVSYVQSNSSKGFREMGNYRKGACPFGESVTGAHFVSGHSRAKGWWICEPMYAANSQPPYKRH